MPDLYILTGSNGAGKSTVGRFYLPKKLIDKYEIFDGDKLFMQKRRQIYKIETPSLKEAERRAWDWLYEEFENRVVNAINKKDHFIYEGHLPDAEKWDTPKRFKKAGYKINLIYFGLSHPSVSALRVLDRAKMGGHNVPPYDIEKNFYGNLHQLNQHYNLIDELQIVDTTETATPKVLAIFKKGKVVSSLPVRELPEWFEDELPDLFSLVLINKSPFPFEDDK